jgi:hypothetical protein
MKEIAFLEMPGLGINRLSWMGGRYAYVSAHFDGFTDHCLCIVDLNEITKPVIVSKWWLPGMNRAAGEVSTAPKGKRYALHHMIVAGKLGYGAWRDGGFTIHDISDAARPKLLSYINWSPPFPGGTHTALSVRTICTKTGPARSRAKRRFLPPTMPVASGCSTSGISMRQGSSRPGCRRRRPS